jgi:hypothetical protein
MVLAKDPLFVARVPAEPKKVEFAGTDPEVAPFAL